MPSTLSIKTKINDDPINAHNAIKKVQASESVIKSHLLKVFPVIYCLVD